MPTARKSSFTSNRSQRFKPKSAKYKDALEKIYEDKLDGVIDEAFWARKHQEYVQEKERLMNAHEQHNRGTADYLEQVVQIVELTEKALPLYKRVPNLEKRRLLRFLASNFVLDGKMLKLRPEPSL